MVANIRLDTQQVEVLHWDKFKRQQDFDAKPVKNTIVASYQCHPQNSRSGSGTHFLA